MAIQQVTWLRDCRIFRDFTWPNDLPSFGRYNLIYGWNGSGKTTISKLLRDLELQRAPDIGHVALRIADHDVCGEDFPRSTLPVRVFNRDFVNENVFSVGGDDMPPIFVVGKEHVEKQKEVNRLKEERTKAEDDCGSARSKTQAADGAFDRFCIDRAKVVKDTLRSSGSNPYNEYDKRRFQDRAQQMAADSDAAIFRLGEPERDRLLAQHHAKLKPKVVEVAYQLPALEELVPSVSELLEATVASAAIQALKDDRRLAEWTRDGLRLHRNLRTEKCLFCEQPLPASRLRALEAHFSAQYEELLRKLEGQIDKLESSSTDARGLRLPYRAELYDDLVSDYDPAEQALRTTLNSIRVFSDALIQKLKEKKGRPFDHIELDVSIPELDAGVVDRLNEIIRTHNEVCDEFEKRTSDARDRLALDMIARELEDLVALRDAAEKAGSAVLAAEEEVRRRTGEIEQLERDIIEHGQPAEELNEDLRKYLGHGELQLAVKEAGYAITRSGEPAQMLSEGETTAIALLYFLKSLEDRAFDLESGVVVLDDPVSSLDQNALFGAFGYIRSRTQAAGQVIILTHNFLFFRLVREWFRNLRGPVKRAWQVFMLEFAFDGAARNARIQAIDPLLMDFDSEYHYLFAQLYRIATGPRAASLEEYYWTPSIARRVLETFLAFRVPDMGGRSGLWGKMCAVSSDEEKKSRIYRYVQTHSHRGAVGDADEDMTLLGESRAVMEDVLDFMRAADVDHVTRMIALVTEGGGKDTA